MNRKAVMRQEVQSVVNSFITFKMIKRKLPFKKEVYPYLERRCLYPISQKIGDFQPDEKVYFSNLVKKSIKNL